MHKNSQHQRNLSLYFKFKGKSKLNVPNIMFTFPLRTVCRTWPAAGCTWLRGPWPSSTTPTRGQYTSSTTYSSTRYSCSQCIAAQLVYKQYYILFDQVQQFSKYSCTAHLQAVLHTLRPGTSVLRVQLHSLSTSSTSYSTIRYSSSQSIAAQLVYKQYYILYDQVQLFSVCSCKACLHSVLHTLRPGTAVLSVQLLSLSTSSTTEHTLRPGTAAQLVYKQYYILSDQVQLHSLSTSRASYSSTRYSCSQCSWTACLQAVLHTPQQGMYTEVLIVQLHSLSTSSTT